VLADEPTARLSVAGAGLPASVRARPLPEGVELLGEVEDLRTAYWSHRLLVAPLRAGSGTRLKILEAFAAGLPVVTTPLGAEGIEAADGIHLRLADGAQPTADAIVALLRDEGAGRRLAAAARRLVEERYDWRGSADRVVSGYAELLAREHWRGRDEIAWPADAWWRGDRRLAALAGWRLWPWAARQLLLGRGREGRAGAG
jgi:glycosyltransferase involved in cell wall biosynthesis